MIAWLNGDLVEHASIDATDRGFTLGDGLFETMRAAGGRLLHRQRHLARLRAGAEILGLDLPIDETALEEAAEELLDAAGLDTAALRLTLTRGTAPRGLPPPPVPSPTLLLTAAPLPAPAPPAALVVATVTRRNEHSPVSRIKSLNYLDNVLARMEATRRGADDALILNTVGKVVETTVANLFVRFSDKIVTPPASDGALPGVARSLVLEGMAVAEHSLMPSDLAAADEMVLTNILGARAVTAVDGRPLRGGDGLLRRIEAILSTKD